MPPRRLTTEPSFIDPQVIPEPPTIPSIPDPRLDATKSSGAPPEEFVETRRVVGTQTGEEVTELTAEERASFASLMSCGKRSKTIDVLGHTVVIESLNNDDDIQIGMFTKEYKDSDAYARAVHVGTCAAGIRTVDGRPLYNTISTDETSTSIFRAKVNQLLKYHPISVTEIYREILNLDAEFAELAIKLGKLKG
jgi:hypothetical protein